MNGIWILNLSLSLSLSPIVKSALPASHSQPFSAQTRGPLPRLSLSLLSLSSGWQWRRQSTILLQLKQPSITLLLKTSSPFPNPTPRFRFLFLSPLVSYFNRFGLQGFHFSWFYSHFFVSILLKLCWLNSNKKRGGKVRSDLCLSVYLNIAGFNSGFGIKGLD